MSAGTKKLKKELYGHPSVLGHDVLSVGVAAVSGVVGHTVMTTDGTTGHNRFVLPRGGYLDFACANISPVVASGSLEVALHKNGAVVMSGALSASNPAQFANVFQPDLGNSVTVASGDVIQAFYAISAGLGAVGVGALHAVNLRVGLTYRDAQ